MSASDKEEALLEAVGGLRDFLSSAVEHNSPDKLLVLLDRLRECLFKVKEPATSTIRDPLSQLKQELVVNELLSNSAVEVKLDVASCLCDITRIEALNVNDKIKDVDALDVFRFIVSSFENFHENYALLYVNRARVLDKMNNVMSWLAIIDPKYDSLLKKMFQHFLEGIRKHPRENDPVFTAMETIMTTVLNESDEISLDLLLDPLLDAVAEDSKEVEPIAKKLGKNVIEKCAAKLNTYLINADSRRVSSDNCRKLTPVLEGTHLAVDHDNDSSLRDQLEKASNQEETPIVRAKRKRSLDKDKEKTSNQEETPIVRAKRQRSLDKDKDKATEDVKYDDSLAGKNKFRLPKDRLKSKDKSTKSGTKSKDEGNFELNLKEETSKSDGGTKDASGSKIKAQTQKVNSKSVDVTEKASARCNINSSTPKAKSQPSQRVDDEVKTRRSVKKPRQRADDEVKWLSFASLVAGLRSKNKIANRQFKDLLFIEWTPTTQARRHYRQISEYIKLVQHLKQRSKARLFLNKLFRGCTHWLETGTDLVLIDPAMSAQFKVLLSSKEFTSLGLVFAGLWSDQSDLQLLATKKFRNLLHPDDCCPPRVRFILDYGVVPRLVEFLDKKDSLDLQKEAALALIDIAGQVVQCVSYSVELGLVGIVVKILDSPDADADVREKAVFQLARLASIRTGRDLVHQHDGVQPLLVKVLRPLLDQWDGNIKLDKATENDKLLPKLRTATLALLRFCKADSKPDRFEEEVIENKYGSISVFTPVGLRSKAPHLDKVKVALPVLFRLVNLTDEEVLANACWLLAQLTDSNCWNTRVGIDSSALKRLVELLGYQSTVVTPALRTLRNILYRDDSLSQLIFDFGALPCLWNLLSNNIYETKIWRTIARINERINIGRIKAAQLKSTSSQFSGSRVCGVEEKQKIVVKEKLDESVDEKLSMLCTELCIHITMATKKEDVVAKLMDFLDPPHALKLLAEKEEAGTPQQAEIHELEDDNEEESVEGKAVGAPEGSAEQMSDQGESQNENESDHELRPSDDQLCGAIGEIIKDTDITKINITGIVKQLSQKFRTDLSPRKSHVMIMLHYQLTQ